MIGFAGLSHLGIVSSIAVASKGFEVIAYDPTAALCEELSNGNLPVFEPDLAELLATSRSRIRFIADPAALNKCDVLFFSVDVPTDSDNRSDLSTLHWLIDEVVVYASPSTVLVVLSQVPPGFTHKLANTLKRSHDHRSLQLFYQVETLIFGCAVERALQPERFIVGCSDPKAALPTPYADMLAAFDCPILRMRYESAELAKISINMFLVSSISVANTLAELCEVLGADWSEIIPALKLDKRIGPHAYLSPGLGLSGGNLERDLDTVSALAREFGTDAGVVDAWISNSRHRRDWVLKTIHSEVASRWSDPVIAIWGLAYKPNTISTKNSPALDLLEALAKFSVRAHDPQVVLRRDGSPNFIQVKSALDACRGAHALVIMTPWHEFSSIRLAEIRGLMTGQVIVDPFGMLDRPLCDELGFLHFRLGSPAEMQEYQ